MTKYVIQRVLLMLMTLLIITCIAFVLVRMLPPAELPLNDPHTAVIEARREAAGYNKPYLVQFGIFLRDIFTRFDWGVSDTLYFGQDVWKIFVESCPPPSASTCIPSFEHSAWNTARHTGRAQAQYLGRLYDLHRNDDRHLRAELRIRVSDTVLPLLQARVVPVLMKEGTDFFSWSMFVSMLPAVLSLSFGVIASFTRTTRAELTEVLTSEFMLLARTKGLTRAQATVRHALKNCMVVVVPEIFATSSAS